MSTSLNQPNFNSLIPASQVIPLRRGPNFELEIFAGIRTAGAYPNTLAPPGGKVEPGHTFLSTAITELTEEAGGNITPEELHEIRMIVACYKNRAFLLKTYILDATDHTLFNASPDEHRSLYWRSLPQVLNGQENISPRLRHLLTGISELSQSPISEIATIYQNLCKMGIRNA